MMRKAKDKGSPYLTPYIEEKNIIGLPLTITENQAPKIQALT